MTQKIGNVRKLRPSDITWTNSTFFFFLHEGLPRWSLWIPTIDTVPWLIWVFSPSRPNTELGNIAMQLRCRGMSINAGTFLVTRVREYLEGMEMELRKVVSIFNLSKSTFFGGGLGRWYKKLKLILMSQTCLPQEWRLFFHWDLSTRFRIARLLLDRCLHGIRLQESMPHGPSLYKSCIYP